MGNHFILVKAPKRLAKFGEGFSYWGVLQCLIWAILGTPLKRMHDYKQSQIGVVRRASNKQTRHKPNVSAK
jgi:hypothetical protein